MSIDLLTLNNNKLIMAGHMAIANSVLDIISRPDAGSPANVARLEVLHALQDQYYEVMAEPLSAQLIDRQRTAGKTGPSGSGKE